MSLCMQYLMFLNLSTLFNTDLTASKLENDYNKGDRFQSRSPIFDSYFIKRLAKMFITDLTAFMKNRPPF